MVYKKMCKPSKEHPAFLRTWSSPKKGPRFVMAQPPCVWNLCWRSTCRMWRRSPDRVSGPHAPSAVAAQQKLHRSSPAVRAAVARVAQDGRGAGRGSSPIAPCQHRCRCSSHTEQGGVVPSMTDQVLGTANLWAKRPYGGQLPLKPAVTTARPTDVASTSQ